jgi:hypothetical protein
VGDLAKCAVGALIIAESKRSDANIEVNCGSAEACVCGGLECLERGRVVPSLERYLPRIE